MFKKIIITSLVFCICIINSLNVLADDGIDNMDVNEIEKAIEAVSKVEDVPKINSRYAIILDRESKRVLYGKNEKIKTKMASTTKIMTSLIIIENANLNDIVKISSKAAGTGGSRLKLNKGDKISVKDLLYGLMLRSGNDAAVALAEHVGGSVEGFAKLMNKKAEEIGLENTNFVTPHGLDADEHYTTAYELAMLTDYALENEIFASIVNTKTCNITINGYSRAISNTNELLGNLNGVYGVKTGFTNGAGRCLVTSVKRDDLDIICVVLGADTKKIRTIDSIKLIEYTFRSFQKVDITAIIENNFNDWKNINSGRIIIEKGIKKGIDIKLDKYNLNRYTIKNNTENLFNIKINAKIGLIAPVEENVKIGELQVMYGEEIILNIPILTAERVRKKGIVEYMLEMTRNYSCYLEKLSDI